jgi:hypothetical protein
MLFVSFLIMIFIMGPSYGWHIKSISPKQPIVSKTTPKLCRDRNEDFLNKKFTYYRISHEKSVQTSLKHNLKHFIDTDKLKNHSIYHLFEETQCSMNERQSKLLNEKSICPWRVEIRQRVDKWPALFPEAKCTCSSCNSIGGSELDKNYYTCMPVVSAVPVLVRLNECDSDGFYKWDENIETVNNACTCSIVSSIITVKKKKNVII